MSTHLSDNLKASTVTAQPTSTSKKAPVFNGKHKVQEGNLSSDATPGAPLTNRAVIALVSLALLVPKSPAKLPQDVSGVFPTQSNEFSSFTSG